MLEFSIKIAIILLFITLAAEGYIMPGQFTEPSAIEELFGSLSNATINAVNFEASNRAHGSISTDSFYDAPNISSSPRPGTLLKVEKETNTSLYTIPPSLALSRFIYESMTSSGNPVPVSAYILWPYTARPYHGGLPLVAWAHGTSGVSAQCAPSNIRNLWHHFQVPYQLALQGYVVVATDYAGLGVAKYPQGNPIVHEYLTSPAQANDVVYSIQAARSAFPELSEEFVVVGSSQGGAAAWAVSQKFAVEPMAGHLGTVTLSPVTDVLSLPPDAEILGLLVLLLVPGIEAKYPDFQRGEVLTPQGIQSLNTYLKLEGCNTVLFQLPNGLDILRSGWQQNSDLQKYRELAAIGGKDISGPMLIIQGETDPIVNAQTTTDAVNDTVSLFPSAQIEYHILSDISHGPAMHAGQRLYMDWIAARFARVPVQSGYHSYVAKPIRPASALQPETNFFLALETEPWQAT